MAEEEKQEEKTPAPADATSPEGGEETEPEDMEQPEEKPQSPAISLLEPEAFKEPAPPPPPAPAAPEAVPADARVFVVKTTANQERAVANLLEKAARRNHHDLRAILVPDELKGYVLVESPEREIVERAMTGVHHARSVVRGDTTLATIEHFLTPKPAVTGITEGAIVELTAGPFKGEKARVKRVDQTHEEITIELFDAMVPIPVTVRGDHVRVLTKEEAEGK